MDGGGSISIIKQRSPSAQIHRSIPLATALRRQMKDATQSPVARAHTAGACDALSLFYDAVRFSDPRIAQTNVLSGSVGIDARFNELGLGRKTWTVSPACGVALRSDGALMEAAALITPKYNRSGPERIVFYPGGLSPHNLSTTINRSSFVVVGRPRANQLTDATESIRASLDQSILTLLDRFHFQSVHLYNLLRGRAFPDLDPAIVARNILQALERFPALAKPIATLSASRSIAEGSTVPAAIIEGIVDIVRWTEPLAIGSSAEIKRAKSITPAMIRRLEGIDPSTIDPTYLDDPLKLVTQFNRVQRERMPATKAQSQLLLYLHDLEQIPDDLRPWLEKVPSNTFARCDYRTLLDRFEYDTFVHLKDYLAWLYRIEDSIGGFPRAARSIALADLLRSSSYWHTHYAAAVDQLQSAAYGNAAFKDNSWEPILTEEGIAAHHLKQYRFEEICSKSSLRAEGKVMKHCVGSYAYYCISGQLRVFRMVHGNASVATLSVLISPENKLRLHQFYGVKNARLSARLHTRVKRWLALLSADLRAGQDRFVRKAIWDLTIKRRENPVRFTGDDIASLPRQWEQCKIFLAPFLPFSLTIKGAPVARTLFEQNRVDLFEWKYKDPGAATP